MNPLPTLHIVRRYGPWLTRHADINLPPFVAEHIVLCESHMGRSGSIYEDIARFPA